MSSETAWAVFEAWCTAHGEPAEPAGWTTLVYYLRSQAEGGVGLGELEARIEGLREALLARALEDLTSHERVQAELTRLRRAGTRGSVAPANSRKATFASETPGPRGASGPPMLRPKGSGTLQSAVELLREVPEEELWLQGQRSEQTRRAYRADVRHFVQALAITSAEELRQVDRAAVIHWVRTMENNGARPRTIRRRLSALSSLFTHLVARRRADANPVREIKRPRVNRRRGEAKAFSKKQARALLDAPEHLENPTNERERTNNLRALRDRALLSVGLQVGARRSEVAHLAVKDFHQNQGFWSLHFIRKGGLDHTVSVNPQTAQRIHEYLAAAGHADDLEGPLFRPLRGNGQVDDPRRHMHPDMVDRILRKYARAIGCSHGFSAHSMRATFITTALDNGCALEDVQRDVGHADPTTTKLYDRRGHNPEKSASFFANY